MFRVTAFVALIVTLSGCATYRHTEVVPPWDFKDTESGAWVVTTRDGRTITGDRIQLGETVVVASATAADTLLMADIVSIQNTRRDLSLGEGVAGAAMTAFVVGTTGLLFLAILLTQTNLGDL